MTPQRKRKEWSNDAACLPQYAALYLPNGKPTTQDIKKQKELLKPACLTCPVIVECNNYAQAHEKEGFWAGLTEAERNRSRNQNPQKQSQLLQEAKRDGWLESQAVMPKGMKDFAAIYLEGPEQVDFGPPIEVSKEHQEILAGLHDLTFELPEL